MSTPASVLTQPVRQRRTLYIVLIALLVAVVAGSGLLVAFNILNKTTTTSQSNAVVGSVSFLRSPNASPGTFDQVKITLQGIEDAPPGQQYYAWLPINTNGENVSAIKWPLTPQNGSLNYTYMQNNLLANSPYLFLITLETAGSAPPIPNTIPSARLYYASLPTTIQNPVTLPIRMCPQGGSNNPCY
jgi:hypothetical protein